MLTHKSTFPREFNGRSGNNLEIMDRVRKLLKTALEHENFLKIKLKIREKGPLFKKEWEKWRVTILDKGLQLALNVVKFGLLYKKLIAVWGVYEFCVLN